MQTLLTTASLLISASVVPAAAPAATTAATTAKEQRDSVAFTTERGEKAKLVLYIRNGRRGTATLDDLQTCPGQVEGVPLAGSYSLALFVKNKLVNEVDLESPDGEPLRLPLRNLVTSNNSLYGGRKPRSVADDTKIEPTKLVNLRDVTGDGKAWEFRLAGGYESCGHFSTILAGYSPLTGRAAIFPVEIDAKSTKWTTNVFPSPATQAVSPLRWVWPCGDHGSETEDRLTITFDPAIETWKGVATSTTCQT